MNQRSFGALVVLNVVLLAALVVTTLTPAPAAAEGWTGDADYLMIAGHTTGRANISTVYIVELKSAIMLAVQVDTRTNPATLTWYTARSLRQDIPKRGN